MNPVWIITGKEVRDSLRNRWVLAAAILLCRIGTVIRLSRQFADRFGQG